MDDAAELGVDMFLLDDGWFGNKHPRHNDTQGLGDWDETRGKLPGGIAGLVETAEGKGIRFGLWIEPEMVNPRSELYEKAPRLGIALSQPRRSLLPEPAGAGPRQPRSAGLRLRRRGPSDDGKSRHRLLQMGLQQPDHQRPFGLSGRKTVALVDRLRTGPVQRTRTDRGQISRPADDALLRRRGTHRLRGAALLHGILAQRQHRPAGAHFHPVGLLPISSR